MSLRQATPALLTVILLLVGTGVYLSLDWPKETALLPMTIGTLVLVLAAALLVRELLLARRDAAVRHQTPTESNADPRGALVEFFWLMAYALAIWLLGFYPATLLYLLMHFYSKARVGLVDSLIWSLLATGVCLGLFYLVLDVSPYTGLIFGILN